MTYQKLAFKALIYLLLVGGALIMIMPFVYLISTAFTPNAFVLQLPPPIIPPHATIQNFIDVWTTENFGRYFFNSTVVATCSTALTVLFSSMLAFAFARYSFPGKNLLFYSMLMTLMLPTLILIIPQFVLAKHLHLLNSLQGLIIVYSAGIPLNVFLLRGFFEDIPRDLMDAAHVDGASIWTMYWRIMMPLARPAIAAVTIFSFLANWDEFTWALTSISDSNLYTLPIGLELFQQQNSNNYGLVFAGSLIAVVPVIVVFIIFQRQFIKGVMASAVKG